MFKANTVDSSTTGMVKKEHASTQSESMIFKDYNPIEDKMFRIIDNDGKVINKEYMPQLDHDTIRDAYKAMLYARTADQMAVSFQRQGRMFTYPPIIGHEAIQVAAASVIREKDWLVPAFREVALMMAKGVKLEEIFLYYMGNEEGSNFKNTDRVLPICVPIGSQILHAAGLGYSLKHQKKDEVVFTYIGDGGTSEGDFSEGLNFAAVWQAPVIFTIQNNQYAISVPIEKQTKSINLAVKSVAFGMPGIKVDGNDFFAMYVAYKEAHKHTTEGKGPVLIEAFTYRQGAHTTSDDPSKYRTKEEEQEWLKTDPMRRLRKYMQSQGITIESEDELVEQYKKEEEEELLRAENFKEYQLEDVFKHMYVDIPDDLKRQKEEYEQFLNWRNNR